MHTGILEELWRQNRPFRRKDRPCYTDTGKTYCQRVSPPKVIYETVDEAWVGAFTTWVNKGEITLPFQCLWPVWQKKGDKKKRGCGRWHLSHRVNALPA